MHIWMYVCMYVFIYRYIWFYRNYSDEVTCHHPWKGGGLLDRIPRVPLFIYIYTHKHIYIYNTITIQILPFLSITRPLMMRVLLFICIFICVQYNDCSYTSYIYIYTYLPVIIHGRATDAASATLHMYIHMCTIQWLFIYIIRL
jgi:hypothetical protein